MTQTIITRIKFLEQYDKITKTIIWKDNKQNRWDKIYGKLKINDNALFIVVGSSNQLLIGNISEISKKESFKCTDVTEIKCSNDQLLQIDGVYPELISRVKANFQPFIHPHELDIQRIIGDIKKRTFVGFYIFTIDAFNKNTTIKLKRNDRIIIVNSRNRFENVKLYTSNGLIDFKHELNVRTSVEGLSIDEVLKINEEFIRESKKSNNIKLINQIKSLLDNNGFFKFTSFSTYHNALFNNSVYKSSNQITNKKEEVMLGKRTPYYSLNQILYGPPGTGKTYNTINKALEIIGKDKEGNLLSSEIIKKMDRKKLKEIFDYYVETGQIVFTTFHQSMSYEDFVEGIKPQEPENDTTPISYKVEDGIFKQICIDANVQNINWNFDSKVIGNAAKYYKMSLGDSHNSADEEIYNYCIENNVIALGYGRDFNFTGVKSEKDIKSIFQKNGEKVKGKNDSGISMVRTFILDMKVNDIVFISEGNKSIRAIGKVDGEYEYNSDSEIRYSQFRKVNWLLKNVNIPTKLIYKKNFTQRSIYNLKKEYLDFSLLKAKETVNNKNKDAKYNYVLIIDEINRGNVSSIFGELITLIEEDKRLGNDEALEITLPYSKKIFGVPPNLYIIGTMNTADRSVEALDTALRRRFSFDEMPPNYNVLKGKKVGEIKLENLLKTINDRIEILLDRDHLIGHSYFLKLENIKGLREAFGRQIIPLLQEYFYGDYGKIALVLGERFCSVKETKTDNNFFTKIDANKYDPSPFREKVIFEINNPIEMDDKIFEEAINILLNKKNQTSEETTEKNG